MAGGVPHIQEVAVSAAFRKSQGVTRSRKDSAEPVSIYNVITSTFLVGGYALEDTEALEDEALGSIHSESDTLADAIEGSGCSGIGSGSGSGSGAPVAGLKRKRGEKIE